jgi:hypothetical protein
MTITPASNAFGEVVGIGPKDELEGMAAAQLIAAHNAAMKCYRRAMIGEQTFEGRRENLAQANKLSRTSAALLEALDRLRRSPSLGEATTRFHQSNCWISRCLAARGSAGQFALMFAALITVAHFSVSDFM